MKFPRYWAKASAKATAPDGRTLAFACWRGSDVSVDDARTSARMAAEVVAARAAQSGEPPRAYLYGERPMREEVVRELASGDGGLSAVVTRNSFGCLVLNTARVMFVDVDLPRSRGLPAGGWLARLLGRSEQGASDGAEAQALARLDAWVRAHPEAGFRVYRTCAGLRYLGTNGVFEPASAGAEALFEALGCDPLYVRLCRAQQSFRARLTPKPWRCGVAKPPSRFPHESAEREEAFRRWLEGYEATSSRFATCAYVSTVGAAHVHREVEPILRSHDEAARADSGLPLA
ncbi:MAG TPA: hypothetical protein VLF14_04700 [Candidatus Binatia bacterium]|nr:hypothetical protein [Candidatus Binatia bacterium]